MGHFSHTKGTDKDGFKQVLETRDLSTLKGVRDYALLVLLWGNALRRSEVAKANVNDFDPQSGTLVILGKGKTQSETVSLGKGTVKALSDWLLARG